MIREPPIEQFLIAPGLEKLGILLNNLARIPSDTFTIRADWSLWQASCPSGDKPWSAERLPYERL
jgi:hypothetical protein